MKTVKTISVGGIDPSSKKIVLAESLAHLKKKPTFYKVDLSSEDSEENCAAAFDFIFETVMTIRARDGQSPRLFLEAPVMGVGGPGATIPQAFIEGAIMAASYQCDAPIKLINNQTWKKRVCGNGGFNKIQIHEWYKENYSTAYAKIPEGPHKTQPRDLWGFADQDYIDSGCLNLFGWKWVEMFENLSARKARRG